MEKELKNQLDSASQLLGYLNIKANNHNYYKIYMTESKLMNIVQTKTLYLGNGSEWNDLVDRGSFSVCDDGYVNFGKCFSFSKSESIAMWMLYGGMQKNGVMIDFTKTQMQYFIKTISTVFLNGKDFFKLSEENSKIQLVDLLYYSQESNTEKSGYTIKRSDERVENVEKKIIDELSGYCKKKYPWNYENECRLIVSIKKEYVPENCKSIAISLDDKMLDFIQSRIMCAPNYDGDNLQLYTRSKLYNEISWDLCNGKECKE